MFCPYIKLMPWRRIHEDPYQVWYHPREDVILRMGPDGTFRHAHDLVEIGDSDEPALNLRGGKSDIVNISVDGRRTRARYPVIPDVDLSQLPDSAEISTKLRQSTSYLTRHPRFKPCRQYGGSAGDGLGSYLANKVYQVTGTNVSEDCNKMGCLHVHGQWLQSVSGGRQGWDTCEDIEGECKRFRTLGAQEKATLRQQHSKDVAALEARCGLSGLSDAYSTELDKSWTSQRNVTKALKGAAAGAAGLYALSLAWVPITAALGAWAPTLAIPSVSDVMQSPGRAIGRMKAQLPAGMWASATDKIRSMFHIDLNSFLPAGDMHREVTGVQTTPLDPHAPPARPLDAEPRRIVTQGMYDGPVEFM